MTTSVASQHIEQSTQPDNDVILSVNSVSKKFCRNLKRSLFYGLQDIASELTGLRGSTVDRLRPKEFWALKDVSFELRRGEALGLVGKNGSGKSTLLRIIAGLIKPDTGSVEVRGRVAPLIALGAGFNPILTGRENIYANMSILGLTTQEIKQRFDEVIEFAEIGDAIDAPVQSYSSGMAARLGFASAIHTEPDILLIDEVLAVGDIKFVAKCHRKLHELRKKGVSFILVSHHSNLILNVCDVATYILNGEIVTSGDVATVINRYERDLFSTDAQPTQLATSINARSNGESPGLDIVSITFKDKDHTAIQAPTTGELIYLCVRLKVTKVFESVNLYVAIREVSGAGDFILHLSNFFDNQPFCVSPGEFEVQLQMPYLGLNPGSYTMELYVKEGSLYTLDAIESFGFVVENNETISRGMFNQSRSWDVVPLTAMEEQSNDE